MKIVNLVFILLFLISAFLQLNDPDPFLWFGIYFSGVIICGLALASKDYRVVFWLALIIYVSFAVFLFTGPNGVLSWYTDHDAENIAQTMKAEKPWIEETREFFGLLILSFAAGLNLIFKRKTKPKLN